MDHPILKYIVKNTFQQILFHIYLFKLLKNIIVKQVYFFFAWWLFFMLEFIDLPIISFKQNYYLCLITVYFLHYHYFQAHFDSEW